MNAIKISAQVEQNNILILRNLPFEKGKKLKISIEEEETFSSDEWKDKPISAFIGCLPNLNLPKWEQHIKDFKNEWGE